MKKLIFIFMSTILIAACSGKEGQQAQQNFPPCTINGHDCREVVQLLEETETILPSEEEIEKYIENHYSLEEVKFMGQPVKDAQTGEPLSLRRDPGHFEIQKELTRYDNPKLQEMGLTVTNTDFYFDGGSYIYELSNGITIFRKWLTPADSLQDKYRITITWPNLEHFVFDENWNLIEHTANETDSAQKKFNPQGDLVK